MKKVVVILLFVFAFAMGCSGGGSPVTPLAPEDNNPGRIGLSQTYTEGDFQYVDLFVEDIPALFQFMLKFEFNPACIEIAGFEPSADFGAMPRMRCEPVSNIPDDTKTRMKNSENGLTEIEVGLPENAQDIASPNYLGRLKFKNLCKGTDFPFSFINDPNGFDFRNKDREKFKMNPDDGQVPPKNRDDKKDDSSGKDNGGNGDKCEKCGKDGCDGSCGNGDKCEKCGKDGCNGGCGGDGDKCDKCGKDGCDGSCGNGDKCDKCGKDGCDGSCGNGDKCDKCGKDGCNGGCGGDGDKCDKCGKDGCNGGCGGGDGGGDDDNGGGCGGGGNGGGCGGNGGGGNGGGCGGGGGRP